MHPDHENALTALHGIHECNIEHQGSCNCAARFGHIAFRSTSCADRYPMRTKSAAPISSPSERIRKETKPSQTVHDYAVADCYAVPSAKFSFKLLCDELSAMSKD